MINRVRSRLTKFFHNPSYALYSQRRAMEQRRWAAQNAPQNFETEARIPPSGPRTPPKILWTFWAQGEANAPPLVQACIESWRQWNPDWEVRVLDENTYAEHAEIDDFFLKLPWVKFANILRMTLLRDHGGVWVDATVLCHRPLDDWLPLLTPEGFFAFSDIPPNRDMEAWFLASEPGNPIIALWLETLAAFHKAIHPHPYAYFSTNYVQQWRFAQKPRNALERDAQAAWARRTKLPAAPSLLLAAVLKWDVADTRFREHLAAGLPLSKLTWKADLPFDRLRDMGLLNGPND